jgi:hypothetical protein
MNLVGADGVSSKSTSKAEVEVVMGRIEDPHGSVPPALAPVPYLDSG